MLQYFRKVPGPEAMTVTEKKSQKKNRALPRLGLQILESLNSGLIVTDIEEKIILFNSAAELITGYDKDSVLGKPLREALGEKNRESLTRELSMLSSRFENRESELEMKSGDLIPIGFTVSDLIEDGERVGTIFIFKDLSEIIEMRKEISKKERLAMVGEMTAGIAHELRNPIAAMLTAAETLRDEMDYDTEKVEYLNWIIGEIKRVNALLKEFFSFARPREAKKERSDIHEKLWHDDELVVAIQCGERDRILRGGGTVPKQPAIA